MSVLDRALKKVCTLTIVGLARKNDVEGRCATRLVAGRCTYPTIERGFAHRCAKLAASDCCLTHAVSDKALADQEEARPSGLIPCSPSRARPVSFTSPWDLCPNGAWCSQVRSRCGSPSKRLPVIGSFRRAPVVGLIRRNAMKCLSNIADEIAVCPLPGGGHRFNGLSSLSEAANRIEPLLADLAPIYYTACMQALQCRLGVDSQPLPSTAARTHADREVA